MMILLLCLGAGLVGWVLLCVIRDGVKEHRHNLRMVDYLAQHDSRPPRVWNYYVTIPLITERLATVGPPTNVYDLVMPNIRTVRVRQALWARREEMADTIDLNVNSIIPAHEVVAVGDPEGVAAMKKSVRDAAVKRLEGAVRAGWNRMLAQVGDKAMSKVNIEIKAGDWVENDSGDDMSCMVRATIKGPNVYDYFKLQGNE